MNARAQRKSAAPQAERSDPEAVGANNRFRRQADPSPTAKQAKIIPLPTAETPIRSTGSAPSEGAATATVAVPTTDKPSSGDAQSTPAPSTGPSPAPERPLDVFAEATPTEKIRRFPALGPALGKQIQTEKSDAASDAASVRIDLPGPQETAPPPALTVPKASKTAIDLPRGETSPVKDAAAPTAGGPHQQAKLTEAQLGASAEDMAGRHSQVDAAIDDIETTAAIRTSAGPAPELPLRGASDPERATAMDGAARDLMDGETAAQRQWTARTKAQVQAPPVGMGGEAPVAVDTTPAEIPATRVPGDAQAYAEAELPETVRTAADSRLAAQMQTGVEGARADALAAETARDTELQTAGSDHEASLETARTQALEERKAAYKAAGGELNDSANTVDRQLAEVDKEHRGEVTKEAGAVTGKVQRRAEDDRKGAQDQLNQAETDARKKKKAAEKEARHEKGKLVKQQGKPSWWDQAVDWIRSAVNDLVDKINTLFNKLRKAIRKIIADARDAAVALLEKGRQWIVAKLDNYQKWLKEQINRYLGAFPAIQGLLLKAVDLYFGALKSAVNRVAEGLKAAVTQLANLYAALLDKILAVYQRVLTTVVQVYGAILTGNFKEAFRIAIISACEIAKVDPNPVLAFVDRAGELAQRALMHLIQFWFNVGSAIGKGIKQFGANIKKHLIGGIIGWLTGALGDSGIEIPQQFDLKGVLRLVMSVMGLTYDRIRRKVVKRLGPGGETAVGRMEKAAGLMRRLATEGPLALWEDLKKAVSELPKLLMAALAKWLSIAIIKEATIWLLALVFPVSAVLKIVKLLFDLVQFLIERFRQIVDFVKSVYNAIKEIILGNVQKAADAIESAMARSLPVIISFLASLIGLGGIGKAVRGVITKLRRPIDKVVDKVIKKLVKLGRRFVAKGKAAAKKLRRWWQARRRFTTKGGEAHEISFKGEGKRARLMVKSTPKTYQDFLDGVDRKLKNKDLPNAAALQKSYSKAVLQHKALNSEIKTLKEKRKPGAPADPKLKKLEDLLKATKALMEEIEKSELTDLPKSNIKYRGTTGQPAGFGKGMTAAPLTVKGKPGSEPKVEGTKAWNALNLRRGGEGSYYIKGHLLNHHIHGPGDTWKNLVPLSRKGNKQHEKQVEDKVKSAVIHGQKESHKGILHYTVRPQGSWANPGLITKIDQSKDDEADKRVKKKIVKAEKHVPKRLVCEAFAYDVTQKKADPARPIVAPVAVPNPVDQSGPAAYQIGDAPPIRWEIVKLNLNNPYPDPPPSGEKEIIGLLSQIASIGQERAKFIYNYRYTQGGVFTEKGDVEKVSGIGSKIREQVEKDSRVVVSGKTIVKEAE